MLEFEEEGGDDEGVGVGWWIVGDMVGGKMEDGFGVVFGGGGIGRSEVVL